MDDVTRAELLGMIGRIHHAVEDSALRLPAAVAAAGAGEASMDRQRMLLADMATHLLQTALKPGAIELDKLRNNLHAILTISDRFLPGAGLKDATAGLYEDRSGSDHS